MNLNDLKNAFEELRSNNERFIDVSNLEWYALLKDEIRNSIAIEGIFANRKELLDVLEKNKRTSSEKVAAIMGYFEAASSLYDYANNLYREREFQLRLADIKQIHTLLTRYESEIGTFNLPVGNFRTGPIEAAEASFLPLQAEYLQTTMTAVVNWVNHKLLSRESDILTLSAASHILFETIHPFHDGNGRVGRILLNFILIGCGYANIAIKGVHRVDRESYYSALESGDNEFNKMLRVVESGESPTIGMLDDYTARSNLKGMKQIILERLKSSLHRLARKSITSFSKDDRIPLRQAAQLSNYSQDYLRNLINLGKLSAQKQGKLWYVRVQDLEAYIEQQSSS